MSSPFIRRAAAAACGALATLAHAQSTLPAVTVTGNPLASDTLAQPSAQLSGPRLLLQSQGSLGETLNQLPGVSSTYFGPAASRPVIRGLDGDRIRILQNGIAARDASNVSYDHAVAADPIALDRIEVLRGPAALLYGGSAIGGVVNLVDGRIPREPAPGFGGSADLGWASGAREASAALRLDGGTRELGLHADVFRRDAGEVGVPVALPCTQGEATRVRKRLCNSQAQSDGGAFGATRFFDAGYLGASVATYANRYGAVAEDEATIHLRSNRTAVEGLWRPGGWWQSLQGRVGHTDYRHTESDAGVPGTVFRQRGTDWRFEARHRAIGPFEGVVGTEGAAGRFAADGEEAFAPHSRTRQAALFVYERATLGGGEVSFGLRREQVRVDSEGSPGIERFVPIQRRFGPASAALGAVWPLGAGWQATAHLARSQRAPQDYELYADGPHLATGAYELGDATLGVERSSHAEAGLKWKQGHDTFELSVFGTRFANYVALLPTGNARGDDALPEYRYTAVPARFRGVEWSGSKRVWETGGHTFDLEGRADWLRARRSDDGQPLPRIPPWRLGLTAAWAHGPWGARLGFDHHAAQRRVAEGEQPVAGFTLWQASATYRMQAGPASLLWYLKVENASDRLAYSATSILTQAAPGRVPLPGRSVKLGVQAVF